VPADERQAIRLNAELSPMTDVYTDELFPWTSVEAARPVFPVSRLVCDVERFPQDENELMADRGMGTIYKVGHAAIEAPSLTHRRST
jgi:N-formylglutamate deformylase